MGLQARLLSVDDDIKPVVNYLEWLGLDKAQVKQVRALTFKSQRSCQQTAATLRQPQGEEPQSCGFVRQPADRTAPSKSSCPSKL